jgi:hypothetical protein
LKKKNLRRTKLIKGENRRRILKIQNEGEIPRRRNP